MKRSLLGALTRFDTGLALVLKWICIVLFAAITFILTLNIVVRFVPFMSMHWFDEILELLYGALVFYGAAAVWVARSHFSVGDWISKRLKSARARFAYRLLVELLSLLFIAIFFKYALDLTIQTEERTTAFAMSKKWLYACMPITGGIMVLYSIKNIYLELAEIVKSAGSIDEVEKMRNR
jgi:TRAP-type C4-dicarboxylate transport system permease small subunit